MLRAILKWQRLDMNEGGDLQTEFFTVDFDAPEIEKQLTRGGRGPMGFERVSLEGVEVCSRQNDGLFWKCSRENCGRTNPNTTSRCLLCDSDKTSKETP